jgi:hypothetical protein
MAPLLNEGNILSFGNDFSGGMIIKIQPQYWHVQTSIDIPIMISYILKFQCLKFGLWIVTSNLQTSI